MLERSGLLPINPEGNLVPKALEVAIALLEMSNWVISVNIKQLVKKKKDNSRDSAFQHQETVRKSQTKKWCILLIPEFTDLAVLTVIIKY